MNIKNFSSIVLLLFFSSCSVIEYSNMLDENYEFADSGRPIRFTSKSIYINYAGGVEPTFSIRNTLRDKDIKYCLVELSFFNRVGDPATCSIRGISKVKCRVVGPIVCLDENPHESTYPPLIYNSTTEGYEISNLIVEYTDGTKKTFTKKQIDTFGREGWNFYTNTSYNFRSNRY
jgi:hypothetical protein